MRDRASLMEELPVRQIEDRQGAIGAPDVKTDDPAGRELPLPELAGTFLMDPPPAAVDQARSSVHAEVVADFRRATQKWQVVIAMRAGPSRGRR